MLLVVQLAFRKCVLQMYVLMCKRTFSWALSLSTIQCHEDIYIMLFKPWTILHTASLQKTILLCSICTVSKSLLDLRAFLCIKNCLPWQQGALLKQIVIFTHSLSGLQPSYKAGGSGFQSIFIDFLLCLFDSFINLVHKCISKQNQSSYIQLM